MKKMLGLKAEGTATSKPAQEIELALFAKALNVAGLGSVTVNSILLYRYFVVGNQLMMLIETLVILGVGSAWLYGRITKKHRLGLQAVLLSIWTGVSALMLAQGGLHSPNATLVSMMGPIIFMAGFLRLGASITALSVITLSATWYLARNGFLPEPMVITDTYRVLASVLAIAVFFVTGVLLHGWRRRLSDALDKETKEKEAIALQKTQYLVSLNHEIRNPLTAMLAATDALKLTPSEETQRQMLRTIAKASQHVVSMLNDVIEAEKLEVTSIELDSTEFDVEEVFAELRDMFFFEAQESSTKLEFSVHKDCPKRWNGPVIRINQVLVNLVKNAIKYAPGSSIQVEASLVDGMLRLQVKDNGPGISEEVLETLFQPFSGHKKAITSSGLGLYISQTLLTKHMHSELHVESKVGLGTMFYFQVPLKPVEQPRHKEGPNTHRGDGSLSVLIVDDNQSILETFTLFFEAHDFQVTTANSPDRAIAIYKDGNFDVVMTDLNFGPDATMDGIQLTKNLVALRNTPVIGITGNVEKDIVDKWASSGARKVVLKPFNSEKLLQLVRECACSDAQLS